MTEIGVFCWEIVLGNRGKLLVEIEMEFFYDGKIPVENTWFLVSTARKMG
jgi:hypothetical protein